MALWELLIINCMCCLLFLITFKTLWMHMVKVVKQKRTMLIPVHNVYLSSKMEKTNTTIALHFYLLRMLLIVKCSYIKVVILHTFLEQSLYFHTFCCDSHKKPNQNWRELVTSTDTGSKICRISAAVALLILSFSCFTRAAQNKQCWKCYHRFKSDDIVYYYLRVGQRKTWTRIKVESSGVNQNKCLFIIKVYFYWGWWILTPFIFWHCESPLYHIETGWSWTNAVFIRY